MVLLKSPKNYVSEIYPPSTLLKCLEQYLVNIVYIKKWSRSKMVVYNYSSKSSLQRLYNLTADEVRARMSIIPYKLAVVNVYPCPTHHHTLRPRQTCREFADDNFKGIHDDVIKWKHFPRNWPFLRGIHRSRWIPHTKASDAELWCFLWSASE